MAVFHADKIDSTQFQQTGAVIRFVQGGYVDGLPTSGVSSTEILFLCRSATGMPPPPASGPFTTLAGHSDLFLTSVMFRGVCDGIAEVQLVWESFSGTQPTTYLIEDDYETITETTTLIPGTGLPIRTLDYPGDATSKSPAALADNIPMAIDFTVRVVNVTVLRYGSPPTTSGQNATNASAAALTTCSNSDAWLGYSAGFWKLIRNRTIRSPYQGYYTHMLAAASLVWRDWSKTGILIDTNTGKHVKVSASEISSIRSFPYVGQAVYAGAGIVRACPYPTTSFASIFGFSTL